MTQSPLYPRIVVIGVYALGGLTLVLAAGCAIQAAVLVIGAGA